MSQQDFGGEWTERKLTVLEKYLEAYTKALKNKGFFLEYIDGFAGTGYRQVQNPDIHHLLRFEETEEQEFQIFLDGSIKKALAISPGFDRFRFIEKHPKKIEALNKVCVNFPQKSIDILQGDANDKVQKLCEENWIRRGARAVLFLDPFGLQVEWETLKAVAATQAIDLWLLFPIGTIIRMLSNSRKIDESWCRSLDRVFGDRNWYESFYRPISSPSGSLTQLSLFECSEPKSEEAFTKVNDKAIADYFRQKLSSIFPGVARNPLYLRNSKNFPLYLLYFAASNPNGAPIAIKIAERILGKELA